LLIKIELYNGILALIGVKETKHFVEDSQALTVVCEKEEMLQVYTHGYA
jgi:hypothetical protein